jgi:hypothetical protein
MICNIAGRIYYVSENFGLGSLHDDDVGFAMNSKFSVVRAQLHLLDLVRNVMNHAQRLDFVFQFKKKPVHSNRLGCQVSRPIEGFEITSFREGYYYL